MGARLFVALAQAGFQLLDTHAAAIEAFASAHAPEAIDQMIAFVERHFPRATLQGRMAEGPILDFLRSAKPEIVDDITQAIDDGFGALEAQLARYIHQQ